MLKKIFSDDNDSPTITRDRDDNTTKRIRITATDFIVLYRNKKYKEIFNIVIIVYFIDTASNLIRYIKIIRNYLRDSGV